MGSLMEARRRILLNSPHVGTVSGGIASFKTDMDVPLKSLTATGNIIRCGKNLVGTTIAAIKARNTGGTWSGNVYTATNGLTAELVLDSNGKLLGVMCSNTNSSGTRSFDIPISNDFVGKTLMMSGGIAGGKSGTYRLMLQNFSPSAAVIAREYSGGSVKVVIPTGISDLRLRIAITGVYSNLYFRPMLTVEDETDQTYEVYTGDTYTAGQTITALKGRNCIWSDSGNVTVKYWTH